MKEIGFVFTGKEMIYIKDDLKFDSFVLYVSTNQGNTSNELQLKEGENDG